MPAWQTCLVVGIAATLAYTLLPAGAGWQATGYGLIGASCVVAVVGGVRFHRPDQPGTWYAFIVGLAAWLASTVIDRATSDPPPSPVSGALELAGYPLMCWALVGLIRGRARAHDRTALIDAGLVAASLGLLYWIFMLDAVVADTTLPWGQRTDAVVVAAGDIVLFVLVSLLVTTPGARTASYRLLLVALLLTAVSDILFVMGDDASPGRSQPTDVLSLLANSVAAAAVWHPSMRRLTVPLSQPPAFVRPRLILLIVTLLLPPAVGLYQGATGHSGDNWLATGICSVTLFLLVGVRMAGLLRRVETQARRLAQLAQHDALTGLPNRRQWDERLTAAVADSAATGQPLFVALIDLDHFKKYNDTYGHQAGDELLATAAAAWREQVRDGDVLARYGGEEFGMLLSGCTAAEATGVLDRLLAVTPQRQTFSAGLARWDGREGPHALLHRADQLLYASKRAGRARITADIEQRAEAVSERG
ncbi:diguanylate cyclase (GGDEF)-like protein [Actinoplanes lutulentus]|uniref:Diguanylate cyclase (GGDEF)-like protein n=2 Tax=Actinoplanes lutulentus TaxID=1287878 RepID=A0A327ZAF8_9ACTN|nr:diguanylate cyclase (GGDEF)-like protein [Actinoplanes lutulentus]